MAKTLSTMLPLGTVAPSWSLPDTVGGDILSLDQLRSKVATLMMFVCNHCPYVKHVQQGLVALARDYQPKGVAFVAISSNDARTYPQDGPEQMKREAQAAGYPFPYLYDGTQDVARAYQAACTPDFFLFDGDLRLIYRGQLDDSRPGSQRPVTGGDIRAALDAVLAGRPVGAEQVPSVGCNIKWAQ